jgi:processive 1,2-diacylglycerol beta-glucosyltransferase
MNRKKILLTYITDCSGHHRASLAIEKALKKTGNKVEIMNIDLLKYLLPLGGLILNKIYMRMLAENPKTWENIYDDPKLYSKLNKWIDRLAGFKSFKLAKLIEKFTPDIVCSTQAFPALMLAEFKSRDFLNMGLTPIVGVLTDYSPHRYWVHPNIDLYVVPSKETGKALAVKGVKTDRIKEFGIPIDPKFTDEVKKEEVFRRLQLVDSLPIVLMMGGSQGLGPIKETIRGFNKFSSLFQLVVVCGKNQKLKGEIEKELPSLGYPIKVLGYVENINELMKISSLVITKPGGLTVSESLACNLPIVITNPIPGQEMLNAKFLLEHQLGVKAFSDKNAVQATMELLKNNEDRERMRRQTKIYAKPEAALTIAEALIKGWS